jgi:YidC/Oxa1 family membrane protein insertase
MKMEKRALIAFVASILLFLAYDALYLSPRVDKQRAERAAALELQKQMAGDTVSATDTVGGPGRSGSDKVLETSEQENRDYSESTDNTTGDADFSDGIVPAEATEFVVVTPLYEMTLSTAGADIVSMRLLAFETLGEPVELIPQDTDWTYSRTMSVALEGQNASRSLSGLSFVAFKNDMRDAIQDGSRVKVDESKEFTEIVFRASHNGTGSIERYYRFYPDRYDYFTGVRFSGSEYSTVTNVSWSFGPGLHSTEENVKDDVQNFRADVMLGEEIHRLKPRDFGKKSKEEFSGTLTWLALQSKYFISAIMPIEPSRSTVVVTGNRQNFRLSGRVSLPAVASQGTVDNQIHVYMGPIDYKSLGALHNGLDKNIQMGWSLIRPVSWVVLWSITWMYKFIPNYGLIILIISILTKILFYRLTHKSFKSMKDMQDLQPRIQALKEKYKDDKQKQSSETMKLYKEAGVNPLGGCLPLLLQMPVFVALFNVLRYTIELRQAPFFGWITDLSQQDVLFTLPVTLPVIGNVFSLLPLIMGAAMFFQTKLGGSVTGSPGAQTTPKGFNSMMPILFTFLFYKMPSGLVVYWIVNTVLSVAQQYYIHKEPDKSENGAAKGPGKLQKSRPKSKGR